MATSQHLEKVLARAEDQLVVAGKKRPTEVLATYKKFLKLEEHRLRLKHQAGGGGLDVDGQHLAVLHQLLAVDVDVADRPLARRVDDGPCAG